MFKELNIKPKISDILNETVDQMKPWQMVQFYANPFLFRFNGDRYREDLKAKLAEAINQGDLSKAHSELFDYFTSDTGVLHPDVAKKFNNKECKELFFIHTIYHLFFPTQMYDMRAKENNPRIINYAKFHSVFDFALMDSNFKLTLEEKEEFIILLLNSLGVYLEKYLNKDTLNDLQEKAKDSDLSESKPKENFEEYFVNKFLSNSLYFRNFLRRFSEIKLKFPNPQTVIPYFPRDIRTIDKEYFLENLTPQDYQDYLKILKSEFSNLSAVFEMIFEIMDEPRLLKYKRLIRLRLLPQKRFFESVDHDFSDFYVSHYIEVIRSALSGKGGFGDDFTVIMQKKILKKFQQIPDLADPIDQILAFNNDPEDINNKNFSKGRFMKFNPTEKEKNIMQNLIQTFYSKFFSD